MTDAATFVRRSPLRRALGAIVTPQWKGIADSAVVDRFAASESVGRLAMADFTPLPRLGFKGRGTIPAMQARGLVVEATPNRTFVQPEGGLCLVLASTEVLLLGGLEGSGEGLARLERDWRIEDEERTYPVPRRDSHAWFALAGPDLPSLFAKLCGVDLRPQQFPDLSIAQTSVARLNAIVVRADRGGELVFHLLADSAAAGYLWACLLDAAHEFGGRVTGLQAFIDLKP